MGILDLVQSLAGQAGQVSGDDHAKVAGGFLEALTEHPEGIQAVLGALQSNGMGQHAESWGNGQAAAMTPGQAQQGLAGSGLIEAAAAKAGVSPEIAHVAVAAILPMVIQHFAPNGQAAPQSSTGGLAESLLGKLLS